MSGVPKWEPCGDIMKILLGGLCLIMELIIISSSISNARF